MRPIYRKSARAVALGAALSILFPAGGCSEEPDVGWRAGPLDPETPLERAMGGIEGIVARRLQAAEWQERQLVVCMRERGWEYVPRVASPASLRHDYLVGKYQVLIADEAVRARWGYGVATRFAADGAPYPYDGALLTDEPGAVEDPNAALLGRFSPDQREAWQAALVGPGSADEPSDEPSDAGARPACVHEVADRFAREFPGFVVLTRVEIELERRMKGSPELAAATERWRACMLEHGFTVRDPLNPATALDERVGALQAAGELRAATLAPLQRQELAMAEVDWACREATLNPVRLALAEQFELELLAGAPELEASLATRGP